MKVTKELRQFCRNNGMKIYVSGAGRYLFNLYDMRTDRLICNWEKKGGILIKGKIKTLNEATWALLPAIIHNEQELVDAIKIIKGAIFETANSR